VRAKTAFISCLAVSIAALLAIDLYFGPRALAVEAPSAATSAATASTIASPLASTVAIPTVRPTSPLGPGATAEPPPPPPEPQPPGHIVGVVVRFESEREKNPQLGQLKVLAEEMKADPSYDVVLEGHSDSNGNEYYNLSLSLDRANWARDRLAEFGVAKGRIRTVGLGSARPLPDADPESATNRRVEVRWVKHASDGGKD
jgi:outer membrane protein OmpA-like peptidoglycan-associated protein